MQIQEIMTREVVSADLHDTIEMVARKMNEASVGILPVCQNGNVVGMITDRDIVVKAVAYGLKTGVELAGAVMSFPVYYCYEEDLTEDVADIMEQSGMRRLPVLNAKKQMTGIVSMTDIAAVEPSRRIAYEFFEPAKAF